MNFEWENSWKGSGHDPNSFGSEPEEKADTSPARGVLRHAKNLMGFVYVTGLVVIEAVIAFQIGADMKPAQDLDKTDIAAAAQVRGPKQDLYFLEPVKKDALVLKGYDDGRKRLYTWPTAALASLNADRERAIEDSRSVANIPVYTPVPAGAIAAGLIDKKLLVSFNDAQEARIKAVEAALQSETIQIAMDSHPDARWRLQVKPAQ